MSSARLSSVDRKDLERFTKFMIYKSLQIIVQSRLGEKVKTASKCVSSGADWFNMAIKDLPEVQNEAKKLLVGQSFPVGQSLCLEIFLKTADNRGSMILEIWYLTMTDAIDTCIRTPHTAYYRMGVALKSILSISRVTPAYKLAREQTADTYIVCYQMYIGEPKYYHLGDGYETTKVAAVPMPTGTLKVQVSYRTKLQMSHHPSKYKEPFELKADHFMRDGTSSPFQRLSQPCNNDYRPDAMLTDGICSPFYPNSENTNHDRINHNYINHDDSNATERNGQSNKTTADHVTSQPITINRLQQSESRPDTFQPNSTPDEISPIHRKISAFASPHTLNDFSMDLDEVPFESLLYTRDLITADRPGQHASNGCVRNGLDHDSNVSCVTKNRPVRPAASNDDGDFVMLELKTPFAETDTGNELNQFYRDCQTAPMLSMLSTETDVDTALDSITQQLHVFETSMKEFDYFVSSLQDDE